MFRAFRPVFAVLLVFGFGVLAATAAYADDPPASTEPVATVPTPTTTTSTTPTVTTPPPAPVTPVVPARVRISGLSVGGLDPAAAESGLERSFSRPLHLVAGGASFVVSPARLGANAYAKGAVTRALESAPGSTVKLVVTVQGSVVRSYVASLAQRFNRKAVQPRLQLKDGRPLITPARMGRVLVRGGAVQAIVRALADNDRTPVELPTKMIDPGAPPYSFARIIVIHRAKNTLDLYRGMLLWRQFKVATGQAAYPTPLGNFTIVVRWVNPWWYPPASPWAAGESPVPPGPGNPLGTRWMGLSTPGVGIHGTPHDDSIGYSLSHGCIRMHIPDAEWLFEQVQVGTPVYIVAS